MPNEYEDMKAIDDTIDYIYRLKKNPLPIFCYGTIQFPPDYTSLKNEYHQIRSCQAPEYVPERKLWHLIVSFDDPPANRTAFHYQYFDAVAALFRMEYQVCYSVHLDTDNLHSHYIISATSYIIGHPSLDCRKMKDYLFQLDLLTNTKGYNLNTRWEECSYV